MATDGLNKVIDEHNEKYWAQMRSLWYTARSTCTVRRAFNKCNPYPNPNLTKIPLPKPEVNPNPKFQKLKLLIKLKSYSDFRGL